MNKEIFSGFPKELISFYQNLFVDNNKVWFHNHKKDYENYVKKPAMNFVEAMEDYLIELSPEINAIPKVNKSLFKINRDIRFSKDKTPYKTHLGIWFWDGQQKRMDSSGFYFHIDPIKNEFILGVGLYQFTKEQLRLYRDWVVNERHGKELEVAVKKVRDLGYQIVGSHYKKVPRGYDKEHPKADYLLFNGLHAMYSGEIPEEFFTVKILDYCFEKYKEMSSIHYWVKKLIDIVEK